MLNKFRALYVEEQGQGMTEYGLVLAVIAIGIVAVIMAFKDQIVLLYEAVTGKVKSQVDTINSAS